MPRARSSPSSWVRSSTDRLSVLPTPTTAMMTAIASRPMATSSTTSIVCWYSARWAAPLLIEAFFRASIWPIRVVTRWASALSA